MAKTAAAPKKRKKLMPIAYIHEEGCTGCGVCIEFCPVDCIYYRPGPEYLAGDNDHQTVNPVVIVDEDVCIGCKLCEKYCPWETIEMLIRANQRQASDSREGDSRGSVRRYRM